MSSNFVKNVHQHLLKITANCIPISTVIEYAQMSKDAPIFSQADITGILEQTTIKAVDKNSPLGLASLNQIAGDIFTTNQTFIAARDILGTDATARQQTLRAVINHEFPPQETLSAPTYLQLLDATHQKEELSRQLILKHIKEGATLGFTPYELDLIIASCELGNAYDELGILWRQDVQQPINSQASKLELTDPYTVIIDNPTAGYQQVTWASRYPEQVQKISTTWHTLADKLLSYDHPEAKALSDYFHLYATAFSGITPTGQLLPDLSEAWRDVDRAWMKATGRLQPIASREYGYYDPNGIRVFPDFRLILQSPSLDEEIKSTQTALQQHLGEKFGHTSVYQATANALNSVQLYAGTDIIFAGSLDFQPAGQSLPNEEVVARECGTKVFVNPQVMRSRWDLSIALAQKVFTHRDQSLFAAITDSDSISIFLAGHEYAEPLFQPTAVDTALGMDTVSLINEDLANLCITGIMQQRVNTGELPETSLTNHAVFLLGTYLRMIAVGRGAPHLKPYYVGHALQGLRRMIDTRFIAPTESGKWAINLERLNDLYLVSVADLNDNVQIAEQLDAAAAQTYLNQAEETSAIQTIINLVTSF